MSEHERQYKDGSDPMILDIINIPLLAAQPKDYQTENWLLDPNFYWAKAGTYDYGDLDRLVGPIDDLWSMGSNTYHGQNDEISLVEAGKLKESLRLISLPEMTIAVFAPGAAFGNDKRRVQARFNFNRRPYRLWVTDPTYERHFLQMADNEYTLGECYATISIGEPHNGNCYKLVAAILQPPK